MLPEKEVVNLPAQTLGANDLIPYTFTLTVRSGQHSAVWTSLSVLVSDQDLPSTGISTSDGIDDGACLKINNKDSLVLNGLCRGQAQWGFYPALGDRFSIGDGFVSDTDMFPFSFGGLTFMISVDSAILVPGVQYTISLTCADGSSALAGHSTLEVCVNAPPAGGSCETCLVGAGSCQSTGEALVDSFRTRCVNWADPSDVPLSFTCVQTARHDMCPPHLQFKDSLLMRALRVLCTCRRP